MLVILVVLASVGATGWWGVRLFVHLGMDGLTHGTMYTTFTLPALAYLAVVIVPSILVLVVLVPAALAWRDPPRIVVFRRFHQPHRAFRLQLLLTKYVAPFGHVFTLADSDVRLPWNVRFPLLLGNLGFLNFRARKISRPRSLRRLARLLELPWRLNINWLVSHRKIFAIRSSDAMWQFCVEELLRHADIVVMDLSSVSASLDWEVAAIERHRLEGRLLLVVDATDERCLATSDDLRSRHPGLAALPLQHYGRAGEPDDPDALESWFCRALASRQVPHPVAAWRPSAAAIAGFVVRPLFVAVGIALVVAPFWLPRWTLAYSPFASQIVFAYLHGDQGVALLSNISGPAWTSEREAGLERLAREHPERATPLLLWQMRWHSMYVQYRIAPALAKIGDLRAIEPLVAMVSAPPPGLSYHDWVTADHFGEWFDAFRSALAQLVQRHGEAAAVPLLDALVRHPGWPPDPAVLEFLLPYLDRAATRPLVDRLAARGRSRQQLGMLIEGLRLALAGQAGAYAMLRGAGLEWLPLGRDHRGAHAAAARLIVRFADGARLTALVAEASPPPELLVALVAEARSSDPGRRGRAIAALGTWPAGDLRHKLKWESRARQAIQSGAVAAYALVLRGDAQGAAALVHCFVKVYCESAAEDLAVAGIVAYVERRGLLAPCASIDPGVRPEERRAPVTAYEPAARALAARSAQSALIWLARCFIEDPLAEGNTEVVDSVAAALPMSIKRELERSIRPRLTADQLALLRQMLSVY